MVITEKRFSSRPMPDIRPLLSFRPTGCHGECPPGRTLEKIVMTRRWLWLKKTVLLKTNAGPRIAFSCQPRGVIIRHSACPEFIEGNHVGKGPYAMHLRQCLHEHQKYLLIINNLQTCHYKALEPCGQRPIRHAFTPMLAHEPKIYTDYQSFITTSL